MTKGIIFLIVVMGAVFFILKKYFPGVSIENKRKSLYQYRRKDFLISRAEHEFFDILADIVGGRFYVFPQVHLPSIVDHKIVGQNWKAAFSHISQKSVDYVICDKAYLKPLLAIELDDKTHGQDGRKERDEEVERILDEAHLPLLRFQNSGNFDKEYIKKEIAQKLML